MYETAQRLTSQTMTGPSNGNNSEAPQSPENQLTQELTQAVMQGGM